METAKPSISFRCSTELKTRIDREAIAVGAKRSDICEKRIAASYCNDDKIEALKKQIDALEKSLKQKDEEINELSDIKQVVESSEFTQLFNVVKSGLDKVSINGKVLPTSRTSRVDFLQLLISSYHIKKT